VFLPSNSSINHVIGNTFFNFQSIFHTNDTPQIRILPIRFRDYTHTMSSYQNNVILIFAYIFLLITRRTVIPNQLQIKITPEKLRVDNTTFGKTENPENCARHVLSVHCTSNHFTLMDVLNSSTMIYNNHCILL